MMYRNWVQATKEWWEQVGKGLPQGRAYHLIINSKWSVLKHTLFHLKYSCDLWTYRLKGGCKGNNSEMQKGRKNTEIKLGLTLRMCASLKESYMSPPTRRQTLCETVHAHGSLLVSIMTRLKSSSQVYFCL